MADPVKNFSKVTLLAGYNSAATVVALQTGHGAKLPDPGVSGAFNVVWWNFTDYPDPSDDPNVEIVRCTARAGDTLTITRAQEGTSAATHNASGKVHKMILALTEKTMTDLQTLISGGTFVADLSAQCNGSNKVLPCLMSMFRAHCTLRVRTSPSSIDLARILPRLALHRSP